jgi:hypothetical protein
MLNHQVQIQNRLTKPAQQCVQSDLAYAFFLTLVCKLSIFRWSGWLWVRQTANTSRWAAID